MKPSPPCPLCYYRISTLYSEVGRRRYWRCGRCALVFLEPAQLPAAAGELEYYLLHENDPNDSRYRAFLAPLTDAVLERLAPGAEGLDYGCGPGPAAAAVLREQGRPTLLYDPFFAPSPEPLRRSYDFILCSEVAEHFHQPAYDFEWFRWLLKPGGWLAVMTSLLDDGIDFANWHYRRDPTHVVFYSEQTFRWLAGHYRWAVQRPHPRVTLLRASCGHWRS